MKKTILLFMLILAVGCLAIAHEPPVSIAGALDLSKGRIILKSGNSIYYCRNLERYTGFIEGLKEGTQVTLEGYVIAPRRRDFPEKQFHAVKLTIGERSYELDNAPPRHITRHNERGRRF